MSDHQAAVREDVVDLLFRNLGAIPDPEFGHINMFPWAVEGDEPNAIKRRVCEALARLLDDAGKLASETPGAEQPTSVTLMCRSCSKALLDVHVDSSGVANIPGPMVIQSFGRMTPECPHNVESLEDQRRRIEDALAQ